MSDSMPIMANSASAEQTKALAAQTETTAGVAPGPAAEDFNKLLDSQLQMADENPSAFPLELLNMGDGQELLTAVPASGNDLPLTAASPGQAVMAPLEVFQSQTQSQNSTVASQQATALKAETGVKTVNELNSLVPGTGSDSDKALNMDEMLMARQQQHLLQSAANNKDSPLFDSVMNRQLASEPASQPASTSSMHNMMNMAGLSGTAGKADAALGLTPAPLNVPPQHPGWNQSMGERLQWMVGQNLQSADIRLDPPELGSMEVRIQIHKDHASISFAAANPQVRDALESAVPRLREMMSDIGLSLGDVNVSQESFTQGQQANEDAAATPGRVIASGESETDGLDAVTSIAPRRGLGMLDAYA